MDRVEVLRSAAKEAGQLLMEHPDDLEKLDRALQSASTASNLLSEFADDDMVVDRETIWLTERLTRAVRMAVSIAEQRTHLSDSETRDEVLSASHFASQLAQSLQIGLDEAYRRDDPSHPSVPSSR
jgi:hypothetical protein